MNREPIISKNIRLRVPDHFEIGDYSIVDDFCYFSTKVLVGKCSHISSGCTVAGGRERQFTLGNYSSLGAGANVFCVSDEFVNDLGCIIPGLPDAATIKENLIEGDVVFEDCTILGPNCVCLPQNTIPEGTVIGALSFVPANFRFEPWTVYAGIPIQRIRARNKDRVLGQVRKVEEHLRKLNQ